ncbi:putative VQ motif-containing protein [Helianthus anomalus]
MASFDNLAPWNFISLVTDPFYPETSFARETNSAQLLLHSYSFNCNRIQMWIQSGNTWIQTSFIQTDPTNFRRMVQEVTGVKLPDGKLPEFPVLKLEPLRQP